MLLNQKYSNSFEEMNTRESGITIITTARTTTIGIVATIMSRYHLMMMKRIRFDSVYTIHLVKCICIHICCLLADAKPNSYNDSSNRIGNVQHKSKIGIYLHMMIPIQLLCIDHTYYSTCDWTLNCTL